MDARKNISKDSSSWISHKSSPSLIQKRRHVSWLKGKLIKWKRLFHLPNLISFSSTNCLNSQVFCFKVKNQINWEEKAEDYKIRNKTFVNIKMPSYKFTLFDTNSLQNVRNLYWIRFLARNVRDFICPKSSHIQLFSLALHSCFWNLNYSNYFSSWKRRPYIVSQMTQIKVTLIRYNNQRNPGF